MPTKKSNWIIKVQEEEFTNVLNEIKSQKIVFLNVLKNISVLVVQTTPKKAMDLKSIKGIIAIEPERELRVQ